MVKKGQFTSKGQVQKFARTVLAGHSVDLERIQISASLKTINLYGELVRTDGHDFSAQAVSNICDDLRRGANIFSDLGNWDLNGSSVRKLGSGSK